MSNMLEQAIIDAKELREAALRNAEAAVVEKYSAQVKETVQKLLEQEDAPLGDEEPDEVSPMEQVPLAHMEEEDEVVVVDLDDIIAAADEEEDEEEVTLDRAEIADEVGIDLEDDVEPGNRDDEIDINEDELVEMFKEMLVVDLPEEEMERAEEQISQDEKEEDEKVEDIRIDGMNADDIEEYERTMAKNESLTKQNKTLKQTLTRVKNKLQEISLQNGS